MNRSNAESFLSLPMTLIVPSLVAVMVPSAFESWLSSCQKSAKMPSAFSPPTVIVPPRSFDASTVLLVFVLVDEIICMALAPWP